jgi:hypothetical protein
LAITVLLRFGAPLEQLEKPIKLDRTFIENDTDLHRKMDERMQDNREGRQGWQRNQWRAKIGTNVGRK